MSKRAQVTVAVLVSTLVGLPAPGLGQAGGTEPGVKWEQTVEMQMQGFSMPPTTSQFCAPKKNWKEPPRSGRDNDKCQVSDVKHDGPRMTWKMACQGKEPMNGDGEIVRQGDGYTGRVTMHSSRGDMVMKMKGHMLGDACDAGETKRTAEAYQKQAQEAQAAAAAGQAKACDDAVQKMSVFVFSMTSSCAPRKADFCARLQTREGLALVARSSPTEQAETSKMCGANVDSVRAKLCGDAASSFAAPGSVKDPSRKGDVAFVSTTCPNEARTLAQRDCAGVAYTGGEPTLRDFCVAYAKNSQAKAPAPSPAAAPATPQEAAQKSAADAAAKKAKSLFGF